MFGKLRRISYGLQPVNWRFRRSAGSTNAFLPWIAWKIPSSIYVHRQGRITDRSFENQSYRASALNLAIVAIVYWNTVHMERAVVYLRSTGVAVPDHLLAHTSPLSWSHISLTGDYLWEQAAMAVDGFRPLNVSGSRLKLFA